MDHHSLKLMSDYTNSGEFSTLYPLRSDQTKHDPISVILSQLESLWINEPY